MVKRQYSQGVEEYLEALVNCGLYGSTRAEVIARLVCDGIRHAVNQRVIPRRYVYVPYNVEDR